MTDRVIDTGAIYDAIDQERKTRNGISWRQVAHEADVSPSTLSRLAQGHPPALEGLVKLADWIGCSLDELLGRGPSRISGELAPKTAISSYLRSRKELTDRDISTLEAIIEAAWETFDKADRVT